MFLSGAENMSAWLDPLSPSMQPRDWLQITEQHMTKPLS